MQIADLGFGDLHHWFERPRATVRLWIDRKTDAPYGPAGQLALSRLVLLERAVKEKRRLPAPRSLSALERPAYIKQVRDELERARVLKAGAA